MSVLIWRESAEGKSEMAGTGGGGRAAITPDRVRRQAAGEKARRKLQPFCCGRGKRHNPSQHKSCAKFKTREKPVLNQKV